MKKYTVLLALLLSISSYAQDSHMALTMGPAFPLGDFAANGTFLSNGYTKTGFNLALDFNYIPTWYFGIGGSLNFSSFGVDSDKLAADYIDFLNLGDIPPIDLPEDVDVAFGYGDWNYVNILVGPTLALPTDYIQFNIKALVGLSTILPPGGTVSIMNENEIYTSYNSSKIPAFGYQLGADVIYSLGGNYSLILTGSYFGTKAKYDVNTEIGEAAEENIIKAEKNVKIGATQVTIGLAYLF